MTLKNRLLMNFYFSYIAKLPEQIVTGMAIPFFNITEEKEVASIISLESTCKPRYDRF